MVWVHVSLAAVLWAGIVLAAVQSGSPFREPAREGRAVSRGARAPAV
jgi:hypothetical protein